MTLLWRLRTGLKSWIERRAEMARPRKPGIPRHLHISPYVRVKDIKGTEGWNLTHEGDARVDRALAWLKSQPEGTVQDAVWQLFVAAVNGELGVVQPLNLEDEDKVLAQKALESLLNNMVIEED